MNIRPKVVLLVASLFSALIMIQAIIQERVVMPSFVKLERADAQTSMTRIGLALDRTLEGLELTASDWSDWGELYQFMRDRNPLFIATYMTPVAMNPLKVDLLMLIDADGTVAFSTGRKWSTGEPLRIDLADRKTLAADFPWFEHLTEGKSARGLLRTNQGIMMLAAAPILDGSGAGKPLGMALMGRLLTPQQVQAIGTQAQATLSMLDSPQAAPAADLVETDTITQVSRPFDDIYGRRLMTLQVMIPRSITARGRIAVNYSRWYLFGAASTVLLLLLVLLNRAVLGPIARVTQHAAVVGAGGDLTARLNVTKADEIGQLAREFDRMVARVAESRGQLADRSYQSGFAELANGVMHNLANAMTPLEVRLSLLAERLDGAPVADVAAAAAELASERVSPARCVELARFIELGCRQIQTALEAALGDTEVIERQSSIVAATLAEQMASARNEHVYEPVRLAELISQTLDIVPDSCRQRLVIDADETLREVGTVSVPRTVLRLVLQNLIINAADAVRAAGEPQGELRIKADIERTAGAQALHIECRDNGVGIQPEHLKRVFEKGFSTKSRATNQGIGLHWCANVVRSLGGRIWAVSEGLGRGTALHLVLPITVRPLSVGMPSDATPAAACANSGSPGCAAIPRNGAPAAIV